jgi:hypothetical protein
VTSPIRAAIADHRDEANGIAPALAGGQVHAAGRATERARTGRGPRPASLVMDLSHAADATAPDPLCVPVVSAQVEGTSLILKAWEAE